MIKFENVVKKYLKNSVALSGINLEIGKGEFVFIVGPSGAGKTTLLRLIIREEKPTEGKILVDGVDVVNLPARKLPKLRRKVGMVFQSYRLLPKRTVYENVAFALEVSGRSNREIQKVVPTMLRLVGLEDKDNHFPNQLSGGEAQRTAIARALVHEPDILLADEPTGNLDLTNAWEIIQLLNQINSWGTTVVMATHNQDIVNALKKRVITMDKGLIIREEKDANGKK
ncbi:cell division ATP-binding protein FtsE [candidate division WWE3 bacterium CG_4_9_14_3_um_filter_43_9]|uniref:Cell division ATP-binding protein FtsE n=1 Tax=candidate division WWE3 bacterium CG_4_9_14_3_um_filter_43_9 TaxID=1975082 RepID=A0A2M7WYW6_UNCKA|nr:MAG: cell division ATP-binding protein FtsE [bacterium CG1_02_42_9]PJA38469.1 MAG: cell division ATP-binding protein FtsE [candidate division WWE3 bacterium CG_4_9_14_3_um_filter_43_9]